MGSVFKVHCTNKQCRYNVELIEGEGFYLFSKTCSLEKRIKENRNASEDVLRLLDAGEHLSSGTSYICPHCKEWVTNVEPFIREVLHVSPYGTIREYKMHYLFGNPKCEKCGTELIHIQNVLSGKNKCPKCGLTTMIGRKVGTYD